MALHVNLKSFCFGFSVGRERASEKSSQIKKMLNHKVLSERKDKIESTAQITQNYLLED